MAKHSLYQVLYLYAFRFVHLNNLYLKSNTLESMQYWLNAGTHLHMHLIGVCMHFKMLCLCMNSYLFILKLAIHLCPFTQAHALCLVLCLNIHAVSRNPHPHKSPNRNPVRHCFISLAHQAVFVSAGENFLYLVLGTV
jgi:hypothetical protein